MVNIGIRLLSMKLAKQAKQCPGPQTTVIQQKEVRPLTAFTHLAHKERARNDLDNTAHRVD
ncbi:hypothetical protein M1D51_12490 [Arthrobacter sp. R3-55]